MGKYKQGTIIALEMKIRNQSNILVNVSNVSCYVDDESVVNVSQISTGFYRGNWQTGSITELGAHTYQFAYKLNGRHLKEGTLEVV